MVKTLLDAVWLFAYIIARYPYYLRMRYLQRRGRAEEAARVLNAQVSGWGGKLYKVIHMDVEVRGRENLPTDAGPVVYVANHQSYIDIPVLLAELDKPHALLAKEELSHIPFLSMWMRALGCVFVPRDDIRGSAAALQDAVDIVKRGESIIVFPEGTRSKDGDVHDFKGGAMRAAVKNKAPIVPVAIDGTFYALEGNHYRVKPTHVVVEILPPVQTAGLSKEEQKALPEKVETLIRTAKDNNGNTPVVKRLAK